MARPTSSVTPHPHEPPAAAASSDAAGDAQRWTRRCLLGLADLSADEIRRGRVVANLFFEDSTRTRLSFTLAAQRLSADVIDLTGAGSSVSKGESTTDTALNVEAMGVDALVVRHRQAGAPALVAEAVRCAVINAGDGKHEHPTQGLLDVYTLAEAHGRLDSLDLSGMTVAIVGDIVSSRVARSNIAALTKLGARVVCVGPPTLAPRSLEALGCEIQHDLDAVLVRPDLAAINMLRIQFERHADSGPKVAGVPSASRASPSFPSIREYVQGYGLTVARAGRLPEGAVVMHPGPMNRGIEIEGAVADGARSVILRQVANGLAVRMAALYLCVGASQDQALVMSKFKPESGTNF